MSITITDFNLKYSLQCWPSRFRLENNDASKGYCTPLCFSCSHHNIRHLANYDTQYLGDGVWVCKHLNFYYIYFNINQKSVKTKKCFLINRDGNNMFDLTTA